MGNKKRKHSQEFKEEIAQRALSGERILALGKLCEEKLIKKFFYIDNSSVYKFYMHLFLSMI